MMGFVATNIMDGTLQTVPWHKIDKLVEEGGYLIDVREEHEYKEGATKGAVNIPLGEVRERISEIPTDRDIYVYCRAGLRSYIIYRLLEQKGFNVWNLDGGYLTYRAAFC